MPNAVLVLEKELPRGKFLVYQSRPDLELLRVKQTHSAIVLNEKECHELEADAMVGSSHTPMAILTADCVPILLLGQKAHALIHAGWRGLQSQILNHELIRRINPIYAYIGPHIRVKHYEVQADFKINFNQKGAFIMKDNKIFFDLAAVTKFQLENDFPGIKIEESEIDTFTNDLFHSYRRNKTAERNWNIYIP